MDIVKSKHSEDHHPNHSAIVFCLEENTRKLPDLMNQFAVKCSVAALQRRGTYAIVSALPINDLTPQHFVYMVLDEAVNRHMKLLAEDILAYVGTNVGLPTELEVAEKRLRAVMKQQSAEMKQQSGEISVLKQLLEQTDSKIEHLASSLLKLEEVLAEQEASRKRDHEALMAAMTGQGGGERPASKRKAG